MTSTVLGQNTEFLNKLN